MLSNLFRHLTFTYESPKLKYSLLSKHYKFLLSSYSRHYRNSSNKHIPNDIINIILDYLQLTIPLFDIHSSLYINVTNKLNKTIIKTNDSVGYMDFSISMLNSKPINIKNNSSIKFKLISEAIYIVIFIFNNITTNLHELYDCWPILNKWGGKGM